jgi:L,D-peptidoglycan transpeptidase YkuD (ErfK/YbiS/YcfS/YnhG family)
MNIIVKNKNTLILDDFEFKCCIGKYGFTKKKIEGDKKTPRGLFGLGNLFFRKEIYSLPKTKLKKIIIKKNMGWCDDPKNPKYNSLIKISKKFNHEKMFRNDRKYDLLIPIKYNMKNPIKGKGSAIFLHLTNDYKPTNGCIALKKKDFLILLKLIDHKTKIKII